MPETSPSSRIGPGWLGRAETHWLCYGLVVVGFATAWVFGRRGMVLIDSPPAARPAMRSAQHRVNPNTADWTALAALPGLGPTLAKRIVAYRQERRAALADPQAAIFQCPQDLQAVKGIGPKKAAAMGKMLFFSDP